MAPIVAGLPATSVSLPLPQLKQGSVQRRGQVCEGNQTLSLLPSSIKKPGCWDPKQRP